MQRANDTNKTESMTQVNPLIKIVGAKGAGKSAFFNYMLGLEFVADDYGNENELTPVSNQRATNAADGYAYSDSRDLEPPIKAVIVILSLHHFHTVKCEDMFLAPSSELRNTLEADASKSNIIFVLNNMGDVRYTYPAYKQMLTDNIRSRKSDLRDLEEQIAKLEEFLSEDNESSVVNMSSLFKTPMNTREVLDKKRELKSSLTATIKLLSLISKNNSVVWTSHLNQDCRAEVLLKLNQMEKVLLPESKVAAPGVSASLRF